MQQSHKDPNLFSSPAAAFVAAVSIYSYVLADGKTGSKMTAITTANKENAPISIPHPYSSYECSLTSVR
jgi:hypothetical protein